MTTVALSVDLIVDIPNSTPTTRVHRVSDSQGADRTAEFLTFCTSQNHSLARQGDVEEALTDFVITHAARLP
jgi:hypothetical protein